MKKKFNLEQLANVYTEKMKPTFEGWLWLASFIAIAITYDLEQLFDIELRAISRVATILFIYSGAYYLAWALACLVFAVLLKNKQHKEQKRNEGKEINDYENK